MYVDNYALLTPTSPHRKRERPQQYEPAKRKGGSA